MTAVFPRFLLAFLTILTAQLVSPLAAHAQNRVALVIAQSAYQKVVQLPNTANDATQMSKLLSQAGFSVMAANDLSQTAMRQAIAEFAAKVAQSGPQTIAAVFYAGHGLQVDGENFLVPVDIDPQRESDIPLEAVRLNDLMNTLGALPTAMRIYMLDSCRNNPFPSIAGATGKGLAMVDTRAGAQGSFISFSTSPGSEAEDGSGADSPYTTALLQVAHDAVPIEEAFKRVRVSVARDTDGRQIPWESSSLTADFRFFGDSGQAAPASGGTAPSATSTPRTATPTRSIDDWKKDLTGKDIKTAYDLVIADDTVPAYEAFIQLFNAPPYGPRVKVFVERRKEMIAWNNAVLVNTAASFQEFLVAYPKSDLAPTAFKLLDRVRNRSLLANAALPAGVNVGAIAPTGGGGGGGNNAPSPTSTPQPTNASTAPTCTCSPVPVVPINIPVIKKPKDDDTPPKRKRVDTPRGPKAPTDSDIAQSGRSAGPQGPPPGVIMEGIGIGIGMGMGMGGGMRGGGGGMRESPPMGGHPQGGYSTYGR
jgi:uncharacterized caspase-like protein